MLGFLENLTNGSLRFANPLGDKFGPFDADEVGLCFVGDGLGQQRLSSTGGTEQHNASGGLDAKVLKQFGLGQRSFNRFLEAVLHFLKPTDLGPAHLGHLDVNFT